MQSVSAPTISMSYVLAVCDAMEVSRRTLPPLLAEAGIAPGLLEQPGARVTEFQFASLYRQLVFLMDDEMPRLFSRALRPGALKFTCISLLDAKNLQVALHRWARVLRLLQDDFRLDVRNNAPHGRIAMVPIPGAPPCKPLGLDLMLKLIHGVSSWLVARRIPLLRVDFSFEAPAYQAEYQTLYPGPVMFGQMQSALHMESSYMHLPIRRNRSELNEFLRRAPEDWVFVAFKEELFSQRMRDYLASQLPVAATAETAAEALHVSTRTLHRQLQVEGTSFQRVKDELRRDIAVLKLTKTGEPIASIGAQLGFDSTASFHRAFRAWTGDTPGAYRQSRPGTLHVP